MNSLRDSEIKHISVLIPYRKISGKIFVYMQKREQNAKRSPGMWGFFGGHAELGETPEQTLRREIKEELNYDLTRLTYLETQRVEYKDYPAMKSVYYMDVPADFEKYITVQEGECGQWFSEDEILNDPKLIRYDKPNLESLFKILHQ